MKLAPSILTADWSRLGEQIRAAEEAGVDYIHLDVMDGHFVPNISFGPLVVAAVRQLTTLPLDVHLMIERPELYVDDFARAGATIITVQQEACLHLHRQVEQIEMHFLPDVYVPCEVCKGKRYNREALEIHYKGKNISEVLEMTVEEALAFFENVPAIAHRLQTLHDVGLGYIHLGQPATTLSGGEAQRIKLAAELSRRSTGRTLYILDEPTTGLHFADTARLLQVLDRLVDAGNTVIVIEHNLDVIKSADWIIDLGPEGGIGGGEIVAQGTPEAVADDPHSYTGAFLRRVLQPQPVA